MTLGDNKLVNVEYAFKMMKSLGLECEVTDETMFNILELQVSVEAARFSSGSRADIEMI